MFLFERTIKIFTNFLAAIVHKKGGNLLIPWSSTSHKIMKTKLKMKIHLNILVLCSLVLQNFTTMLVIHKVSSNYMYLGEKAYQNEG